MLGEICARLAVRQDLRAFLSLVFLSFSFLPLRDAIWGVMRGLARDNCRNTGTLGLGTNSKCDGTAWPRCGHWPGSNGAGGAALLLSGLLLVRYPREPLGC